MCNRVLIQVGLLAESVGLESMRQRGRSQLTFARFVPMASENHEQLAVMAIEHLRVAVSFLGASQDPITQCFTS